MVRDTGAQVSDCLSASGLCLRHVLGFVESNLSNKSLHDETVFQSLHDETVFLTDDRYFVCFMLKHTHSPIHLTHTHTHTQPGAWCSMEVDYSLLTMTSEWERTEEIMNKTDELLKSFDKMADQHLLIHNAAVDPAQFEEAGIVVYICSFLCCARATCSTICTRLLTFVHVRLVSFVPRQQAHYLTKRFVPEIAPRAAIWAPPCVNILQAVALSSQPWEGAQ